MRNEAIALWQRLEEKQADEARELAEIHRKQKAAFAQLMEYACDLDVNSIIEDLAAKSDECFQQLQAGLAALDRPQRSQQTPPVYVGEGVDFSSGAKPFVQ